MLDTGVRSGVIGVRVCRPHSQQLCNGGLQNPHGHTMSPALPKNSPPSSTCASSAWLIRLIRTYFVSSMWSLSLPGSSTPGSVVMLPLADSAPTTSGRLPVSDEDSIDSSHARVGRQKKAFEYLTVRLSHVGPLRKCHRGVSLCQRSR
jgi:hypothetical protein